MANTASTTAILSSSSVANYQAWVTEVINALFTSLTVTQTSDTGQTTNGGSSVPAINTAGGYVIGRFNDAAQSTSPIFFKLEFGTNSTAAFPQMWITIGQGSNGSGTLTGTLSTRVAICTQSAPLSGVTSYVSRYCYNATQGFLGVVFKIGAIATNIPYGGFFLFRDNNASNAETTNSVTLVTNSGTNTGVNSSLGVVQTYSYLNSALLSFPTTTTWTFWPYALTTTTYSSQVQVAPCIFGTPVLYVSGLLAIGLLTEIPQGNTVSMALVGSSALTYLSVGPNPFGGSTAVSLASAANTVLMLWQ